MSVRIVDPASDGEWAALVTGHDSDVFHSPQWMHVLQRTYGFETRAVLVDEGGLAVAGIPFCEIRDIRGDRVVSLPFSDSCDPLVSNRHEWNEIAMTLQSLGHPVSVRVLHSSIPLGDPRFAPVSRAKWHGLELDADVEEIWARIDASARRAIRKARREGLEVRPAKSKDELRDFYDLHLRTRKDKYGLLAQPYAFFENIWSEFVDDGHGELMVALQDGAIIGGIFFLEWKGVMHYKFNASNPECAHLRPNDIILWTAIEQGIASGSRRIDFGLSDWDQEGLLRYKRKYAGEEKTIVTLRSEPANGRVVEPEGAGALLSAVTRFLTDERVPIELTEKAGNEFYRYFA